MDRAFRVRGRNWPRGERSAASTLSLSEVDDGGVDESGGWARRAWREDGGSPQGKNRDRRSRTRLLRGGRGGSLQDSQHQSSSHANTDSRRTSQTTSVSGGRGNRCARNRGANDHQDGWEEGQGSKGLHRADSVTMTEAPPAKNPCARPICQNYAFYGECRFGAACRYKHLLECVGYEENAHDGACVRCCSGGPQELFTGGKDGCVKRWEITKRTRGDYAELDSNGNELLHLRCAFTWNLGSPVTFLKLLGGALCAGLASGKIAVITPDGKLTEIVGHQKSVHAMECVEGILISGDWGGDLCFWRFVEEKRAFLLLKKVNVDGAISCMQAAHVKTEGLEDRKVLWIGGTALKVFDLHSMEVMREPSLPSSNLATPPVALGYLLVGFAGGCICAYSPDGTKDFSYEGDYLSTMEGLISPFGPVLIVGSKHSSLKILKLPEFTDAGSLGSVANGDIRCICLLNGNPLGEEPSLDNVVFVTCAEDAAVALWKWVSDSSDSSKQIGWSQ